MGAVPQTQNKPPGKVNLLIAGITIVLLVVAAGLFLYLRHQGRETAELGAGEYGAFKVVTEDGRNYVVLSGDVISAGPEETDNITFPIQQMITLRSRQNKNAIFKVSLGSSEMPARVAYPDRIGQPEQTTLETLLSEEAIRLLHPGDFIEISLSFPLKQPEIEAKFMDEIVRFSERAEKSSRDQVFDVHYFRFSHLIIYERD